jgi:uncharacterized membrane protein
MNRVVLAYWAALIGSACWCLLLVAAPICVHAGGSLNIVGETIYTAFHRICHQIDGRSLHLQGLPLAACARCTAIYGGFFVGVLLYPLIRPLRDLRSPSRRTLVLAILPMIVDVALAFAGVHESNTISRLMTGSLFGVLLPFVVLPVYLGAIHELSLQTPKVTHHMKGTIDA